MLTSLAWLGWLARGAKFVAFTEAAIRSSKFFSFLVFRRFPRLVMVIVRGDSFASDLVLSQGWAENGN